MEFLQPIIDNFFKFDFLIIIIAFGTSILYYLCLKSCNTLSKILMPEANVALGRKNQANLNDHISSYLNPAGEQEILKRRQKSNSLYVLFVNVCAIFPLMGILGTVIALIPMVGTGDTDLFFMALTSTFWGIVFAIIFKTLNGYLQAKVEGNNELVNTYLLRKDAMEERILTRSEGKQDHEI